MAAQRYYLGIDAGGTKTHALIADGDGGVLGAGKAGPGNWERVGVERAGAALAEALAAALCDAGLPAGALCAAGYGISGYDWPGDDARLRPQIERLGVPGPYQLLNDAFAALGAGAAAGWGLVVIAGTGSIVAGRNQAGAARRTLGLGVPWSDLDGSNSVAALAGRAVSHAYIGRGPATALTERLLAHYAAPDVPALLERLVRDLPGPDPQLAPLVFAAAAQGDVAACAIVRSVGDDLGQDAAAIARQLGLGKQPFDLVLAGGMFRAQSGLLLDALLAPLHALGMQVRPVVLEAPPVVGSVVLALQAAGAALAPAARQRLAAEAAPRLALLG